MYVNHTANDNYSYVYPIASYRSSVACFMLSLTDGNSELAHETKFHLGQKRTSPFADQPRGLCRVELCTELFYSIIFYAFC